MNNTRTMHAEARRTRGLTPSSTVCSAISASPRETGLTCVLKENNEAQN